jgi:hypothetical protein
LAGALPAVSFKIGDFMKIWSYTNKNSNIGTMIISPEEAAAKLRGKIMWLRFRHLSNTAWFVWLALRLLLKGFLLLILETIVFYMIMGNMNLTIGAFLIGDALLMIGSLLEITSRFGKFWERDSKQSLVIGRSFRHFTETRSHLPIEVGIDSIHHIDYTRQPNHHILINGSTSSGKTITMLTVAARASLANNVNFLMIDWNGENEEWAKSVGATIWKVPENFKINLFKLNGMGKEARASMAVESLMVAASLTALQSTKVKSALLRFYNEGTEPSLFDMWNALCSKDTGKANVLNQRFRAIQRVIGYEPEEFWSGIFARNNIISLAGLNESEKSLVVYSLMQRISELFDKRPELNSKLRLMVILDEAWQFFKREREFDMHRESSLEKVVRLGRKYGFGLVVSTQQIEDVPKVFINSCALLMLHQQREYQYFGRDILELGEFESAYLKAAGQGEMLLFDRGMAQKGQLWPDYIKVAPFSSRESAALSSRFRAYLPDAIREPEMPIEMHDHAAALRAQQTGKNGIFSDLDIPSVAVYRFMIAIERTGSVTDAYAMLKEKGWLTSLASLYGGKSKPSILARAISSGYVSQEGKLTEKGLEVINSERIIAKQGIYSGSEEHKELMRRTIRMIQDKGNFAFTLSDKNSFDIGELKAKMKRIWNFDELSVYECQTNAITEEISKCTERAKKRSTNIVFVTNSDETTKAIEKLTHYPCITFR